MGEIETQPGWGRWWKQRLGTLALAGVFVLVAGEAYLRAPWGPQRLEYDTDGVLKPDQTGYLWLANQSLRSAPITLNALGARGALPVGAHTVMVLGDSEGLGVGVSDAEVWTAGLGAHASWRVINASHPGHGPHQHAERHALIQRAISKYPNVDHNPVTIVRVSMQDRHFGPDTRDSATRRASGERRAAIRRFTRFLPYIANKARAQWPAIRAALTPWRARVAEDPTSAAAGQVMWARDAPAWRRIARDAPGKVLFVVYDPLDTAAGRLLDANLREVGPTLRLGPWAFDLDSVPVAERAQALATRLTLGRDPHANAEQHRLMGAAVARYLRAWQCR